MSLGSKYWHGAWHDLIIFARPNKREVGEIIEILVKYSHWSGQKVIWGSQCCIEVGIPIRSWLLTFVILSVWSICQQILNIWVFRYLLGEQGRKLMKMSRRRCCLKWRLGRLGHSLRWAEWPLSGMWQLPCLVLHVIIFVAYRLVRGDRQNSQGFLVGFPYSKIKEFHS